MVLIQHRHILPCGGEAHDLLVDIQRCQLPALTVHRHQPALTAGLVPSQQQSRIAVSAQTAPVEVSAVIAVTPRQLAAGGHKPQSRFRHSAVAAAHRAQIVYHGILRQKTFCVTLLPAQPVQSQTADKAAVLLSHGHRRHLTAVGGYRRRHEKLIPGVEGKYLLSLGVVHLHRRLIAGGIYRHGQIAAGVQSRCQNVAVQCQPVDLALSVQYIDLLASDVVDRRPLAVSGHSAVGEEDALAVSHLSVLTHQQDAAVGGCRQ